MFYYNIQQTSIIIISIISMTSLLLFESYWIYTCRKLHVILLYVRIKVCNFLLALSCRNFLFSQYSHSSPIYKTIIKQIKFKFIKIWLVWLKSQTLIDRDEYDSTKGVVTAFQPVQKTTFTELFVSSSNFHNFCFYVI